MRQLSLAFVTLVIFTGIVSAADAPVASLPLEFHADTLLVRFSYGPFLTPEDAEALGQGEDLVLSVRLELWQKRRFWFDRLRLSLAEHFLLHYDRWQESYTLALRGPEDWLEPQTCTGFGAMLDSLRSHYPLRIVLAPEDFQRNSYLVYALEVRYVTPEKLDEIAGWLVGDGGKSHKSLPDKALGFLISSTGIKNRTYLQNSVNFLPADRPDSLKFRR